MNPRWAGIRFFAALALAVSPLLAEPSQPSIAGARHFLTAAERDAAAEAGDPVAMRQRGEALAGSLDAAERELAASWFQHAAEKGDAIAQRLLGEKLLSNPDPDKQATAIAWIERAANQNDVEALVDLGHCYHVGLGTGPDIAKALAALFRAAVLDPESTAVGSVASIADDPNLRPEDLVSFWKQLKHEAGQGSIATALALAKTLCQLHPRAFRMRNRDDLMEVLRLLEKRDSAPAYGQIIDTFLLTEPETRDFDEAWKLACIGAEKGDQVSAYQRARMLQLGLGTRAQPAEAERILEKLSRSGYARATLHLAYGCYFGLTAEPDPTRALGYLRIAAHQDILGQSIAFLMAKYGGDELKTLRDLLGAPVDLDSPPSESELAAKIAALEPRPAKSAPVIVWQPKPIFPPRELQLGLHGRAIVVGTISEEGRPVSVKVKSCSRPVFGYAAVAAVQQWRFAPALANSRPVSRPFEQELEFHSADESTEWTASDRQQHFFLLRQAAAKGDAASAAKLADYYDAGVGVPLDRAQAFAYREAAAKAGLADAQYKLGEQYDEADGVEQDHAQAAHWYRLAADQNHAAALIALSTLLFNGFPGTPPDVPASVECLRRAADLGDAEAMDQLANSYYRGDLGQEDDAKAFELYKAAALKGRAHATMMVGWFYLKGSPVPQDYAEARRWYQQAAVRGDVEAMRRMSFLYRDGLGVSVDLPNAFEWMEQAARTGDETAQIELAGLLHDGAGIEKDDEEAIHWLQLAANAGSDLAHLRLAEYFANGFGVAVNRPEALRHILGAAQTLGDPELIKDGEFVFRHATTDERPQLNQIIHQAVTAPDLMKATGALPELCLFIMEHMPADPVISADERSLLQRMQIAKRPTSFLALANHAFLGWGMPYDLDLARTLAKAGFGVSAAESERTLAAIDSIAADTPTARQEARDHLRELADRGDDKAARLVAYRAATGIGEDLDLETAKKYEALAFRGPPAASPEQQKAAERFLLSQYHPPPGDAEIAGLIAHLGPRSGDAPVVPVYRAPPTYPLDLRMVHADGSADISFVVDQTGLPRDVICTSSTHPYFARAAESAIKRWRFAPALKNGHPVASKLKQEIVFSESEPKTSPAPATSSSP